MKVVRGCLVTFGMLALLLVFLISSFEFVVYSGDRYFQKKYEKYQVLEDVNMEMEDLLYVSEEMMDYLRGDREDLSVMTLVGGEERDFFNQREKDHMADVRGLFLQGMQIRSIALGSIAVILILLYFLKKREGNLLRLLAKGYLLVTSFMVLLAGVLIAFMARDFTKAFTIFHEIFFTNDLWILDPKTDLLINVLPEGFFIDTGIEIALTFAGILLAGIMVSALYLIGSRKKNKKIS